MSNKITDEALENYIAGQLEGTGHYDDRSESEKEAKRILQNPQARKVWAISMERGLDLYRKAENSR